MLYQQQPDTDLLGCLKKPVLVISGHGSWEKSKNHAYNIPHEQFLVTFDRAGEKTSTERGRKLLDSLRGGGDKTAFEHLRVNNDVCNNLYINFHDHNGAGFCDGTNDMGIYVWEEETCPKFPYPTTRALKPMSEQEKLIAVTVHHEVG